MVCGLMVCGLYLCNPCNPWLNKMVHAQVMLWCLDGLTGLCGSLCSLCNCLECFVIFCDFCGLDGLWVDDCGVRFLGRFFVYTCGGG